jgi:hypothetical protein
MQIYEVLMKTPMKITVFWNVAQCRFLQKSQLLIGIKWKSSASNFTQIIQEMRTAQVEINLFQ